MPEAAIDTPGYAEGSEGEGGAADGGGCEAGKLKLVFVLELSTEDVDIVGGCMAAAITSDSMVGC